MVSMLMNVGSDFCANEIDVGHCTRPGSISTEALRVKPIGVKVSIEILRSLATFEEAEDDQYEGEDGKDTSDDTTGDGAHVGTRTRSAIIARRCGRESELGGTNGLSLYLAIRISGSR